MKHTIETPDIELTPTNDYSSDYMHIYNRGKKLMFSVGIDGTGNEFHYQQNRKKYQDKKKKYVKKWKTVTPKKVMKIEVEIK